MVDGDEVGTFHSHEEAAELRSLIETIIPENRANLENSCANLERVAAYCEANYAQVIYLCFIVILKALFSKW